MTGLETMKKAACDAAHAYAEQCAKEAAYAASYSASYAAILDSIHEKWGALISVNADINASLESKKAARNAFASALDASVLFGMEHIGAQEGYSADRTTSYDAFCSANSEYSVALTYEIMR